MKRTISIVLALGLGVTADVSKADFVFGSPATVANVNSTSRDFKPSISADGLSLYFISNRPGGAGGFDIWAATRETEDDPWDTPVNLGPTINTADNEWGVSISSDGLSLYYDVKQPSASGAIDDIVVATRGTTDDDWGNPVSLGPTVNSSSDDCYACISIDGLSLYFSSNRSGGYGNYDLWVTTRETTDEDWGTPANLGPTVNTSAFEVDPSISADGRILFFTIGMNNCGSRCGYGGTEIWMTRRTTVDDDWSEPVNLGPTINSSAFEDYQNVSADGSTLFFRYSQSGRYGGGDIWQAAIVPIVDFDGSGTVDVADIGIMADHWGTDEPFYDIGPMPWGDGIVDVQDLEVLMRRWGQEAYDPHLITHWKLDESAGDVACDSARQNDAAVLGDPVWRPEGGVAGGALELDGVDDCVVADFVLDPSEGAFSVFAWVRAGAQGQVILSQADGANWLCTDATTGVLMTELKGAGRDSRSLCSDIVITDGSWHRIALVFDGDDRSLYVDNLLAAQDTQAGGPVGCSERLNIGCGNDMAPGTFFTGLIDDVRIYNRAITP